ncbi:MAG: hypothetical protein LBT25_05385 [Candidatus Symbiothrix sp.]|nr:hypothetical protein [Candidatus Symbiothrix sp.]
MFSQSVISGRVTENENEAIEFALVTLKQVSDSDFVLTPDAISLQEVIVKGRKTGVFFDKDTIRYDISSFKDGSEVVLGDLLNKLPGIEVDEKGSVKAHGKQVDKLLLNGQDFFQGNAQMATKNLSANIAESIEILNNYSEYSILSGFQNHEKTVINVGVNKNKLGKISGNLSAGGGMKNKYEFRGDLMQLSSTWMTSIIGAANNNGNEIFSIEDYISLQGGVTEFIGNQEQQSSITLSEEEQKLLVPRNNVYERNSGLAGMNFSYQPKKSFKINSYLLYNDNKEFAKERNQFIYFLPEQRQYETSNNLNINNKNKLFSGFVKMNYQPSSLWDIVYKGQFSTTGIFENTDATNWLKEQQIHAAGYTSSTSIGTKQNIAVMKSFNKHLLISEVSFLYDDKPFSYEMQSDSLLLPIPFIRYDDYYYGKQDTKQKNTVINANFSFFYKLNESYFLRTGLGFSMTEQAFCSGIYQMNQMKKTSLLPDENLKNDYSLHKNDYNFNLNLGKKNK